MELSSVVSPSETSKSLCNMICTIIGDETGNISLEERDSAYLQNMKSGDKVRVVGSYAYEEEGETKLGMRGYGSVIKI